MLRPTKISDFILAAKTLQLRELSLVLCSTDFAVQSLARLVMRRDGRTRASDWLQHVDAETQAGPAAENTGLRVDDALGVCL
jgi:hypothetical protein